MLIHFKPGVQSVPANREYPNGQTRARIVWIT